MRALPIDRARASALGVSLLAAFVAAALAPASAAAHHNHWNWNTDTDQASWSGAGAGWNGGSTSSGTTTTWTPEQAAEVAVRYLRVDRPAISPDGDGEGDEVFVTFQLRRSSAPVNVKVVDAAGATVRNLGDARTAGAWAKFGWDGTRDDGSIVPDGAYRIVLGAAVTATTAAHTTTSGDTSVPTTTTTDTTTTTTDSTAVVDPLSVDVLVDTVAPDITARRPTLAQLNALARRAGDLRDAKRRWAAWANRHRGHRRHRGQQWSQQEGQWVRLWESRQLRLPVTFTTIEDGNVEITAQVGDRKTSMETWRTAGRHTLDVVLPTYAEGGTLTLTFSTSDDAGNTHRHTVMAVLPKMPAPKPISRTYENDNHGSSNENTAAPVTGVPTSTGGPFPDWLDPIMLRATYAAGVPQSWAKSQALANIVSHESSFRPTAQNPTSTAYGLFQFLDSTWATVGCRKTSDAYQQSVCGLRYIQRRYHTPEAAWRFWQAQSPHWY
jgi:hypothetical protein